VSEDDRTNAFFFESVTPFPKRLGHRLLEKLSILGLAINLFEFILDGFSEFWG